MTITASDFSSPDVANLWAWRPSTAETFCVIEFRVGNGDSGDLFSCVVATPEALRARQRDGQWVLSERATLVVDGFDWPKIKDFIERTVAQSVHSEWSTTTCHLQRWFAWEYENVK